MIETLSINGGICAIIVRKDFSSDSIEFFTKHDDTLQLGYMNRKKGYKIEPHEHKKVERIVDQTNEVLFIKSGSVKIKFFNENYQYCRFSILYEGDTVLLMNYGHSFEMLEDTEILEVKQGPYLGDDDKVRFSE